MSSRNQDFRTTFVVRNVARSVSAEELSTFFGLSPNATVVEQGIVHSEQATSTFRVSVNSMGEAIALFKKHNFTYFKGQWISLELWPFKIHNHIPDVEIELPENTSLAKIYGVCRGSYGNVLSVMKRICTAPGYARFSVYFLKKENARLAVSSIQSGRVGIGHQKKKKGKLTIDGHTPKFATTNVDSPSVHDLFFQIKTPEKAKGNVIDVPMNITDPKRSTTQIMHIVPGGQGSNPTTSNTINNNNTSSSSRGNNNSSSKLSKTGRRKQGSAEDQRSTKFSKSYVIPELLLRPGEINNMHSRSRTSRNTLSDWYDIAFICYETLYNMSSKSNQGRVSVSTLTWGSQLDISTFRLHYGSVFTPFGSQNRHPVASCLTVEMRQYGDKDSAAEVLAIRNNGHLYDSCEAMLEGINVAGRGPVMDMKCLESGHLVTSSMSTNQTNNLYVWDMRDDAEQAKVPVVALKSQLRGKIYFDACNGDVCSVDDNGTIHSYDLYTAALSNKHTDTRNLDYTAMTDIDLEYKFFSSCISINGFDSTVLVGSSEHAQIARWDPRSPSSNIFTSTACRRWGTRGSQRRDYDHIYGIEWSPRNTNEFMTVHMEAVRIWDARKMDRDIFATTHCMAPTALRKAQWSPHRSDCIAGLTMDGQVKIWKIKNFDVPADISTPQQYPEELFVHQAHDLMISDFAWCPYVEDVISTVSPGTVGSAGHIQVWRPRNLHESDDNGEP